MYVYLSRFVPGAMHVLFMWKSALLLLFVFVLRSFSAVGVRVCGSLSEVVSSLLGQTIFVFFHSKASSFSPHAQYYQSADRKLLFTLLMRPQQDFSFYLYKPMYLLVRLPVHGFSLYASVCMTLYVCAYICVYVSVYTPPVCVCPWTCGVCILFSWLFFLREARKLLEECMRVLFYRDCGASNRVRVSLFSPAFASI